MDRRMKTALAVVLWIGPLLVGMAFCVWIVAPTPPEERRHQPAEEPARDDHDRLQGTWTGILLERDGRVVYEGEEAGKARVSFLGNSVTFEDTDATLVGTFRLDPTRAPKTFDLTVAEEGKPVTYPAGVYQLNDDTFRLCFGFPATERPSEFDTYPGSGRTLFVYRRAGLGPRAERESSDQVQLGSHIRGPQQSPDVFGGQPLHLQATLGRRVVRWTVPLFFGMAIVPPMATHAAPSLRRGEMPPKKTWDFEADEPGKLPKGFSNEVGRWEVARDGHNHVLAQKAKNEDATFNVALAGKIGFWSKADAQSYFDEFTVSE